jgi:predicted nucleic acid-binding protein
VLWKSIRFSGVSPADADQAYASAESYITTESRPHFRQILDLALASGCSPYDCEFVALAINKRVPLVTNDGKVLAAFPGVAVSLGEFGK